MNMRTIDSSTCSSGALPPEEPSPPTPAAERRSYNGADEARRSCRYYNETVNKPNELYDRIVTVEMLEHVRNYKELFGRISTWLQADGRLFVHVFCHTCYAYPFELEGDNDWMARHFFTGGIMPSADLLPRFDQDLECLQQWPVDGTNYARTLEAWLVNMDAARDDLMPLFQKTYGPRQALRWWVYWRIFFMASAELFNFRAGQEWYVRHYLFASRRERRAT